MGSAFYTYKEAAGILNVTPRTIHNYLKKGYLKRYVENGQAVLSREEVTDLSKVTIEDLPALSKANFYQLINRVTKLELDMAVARKMLDIQTDPIRPSTEVAKGLFEAVSLAVKSPLPFDPKEIAMWVSVLQNSDEVTFRSINSAVGTTNSWEPFYAMGVRLVTEMQRDDLPIEVKLLDPVLDRAKNKIREIAVLWLELGISMGSRAAISPKKAVLKGLTRL